MRNVFAAVVGCVLIAGVGRAFAGATSATAACQYSAPAISPKAILTPVNEQPASPSIETKDLIAPLSDLNQPSLLAGSLCKPSAVERSMSAASPVEPIPTPSALTAGLAIFAVWAGVRVIRRIRLLA
jgi:hypothetical protein